MGTRPASLDRRRAALAAALVLALGAGGAQAAPVEDAGPGRTASAQAAPAGASASGRVVSTRAVPPAPAASPVAGAAAARPHPGVGTAAVDDAPAPAATTAAAQTPPRAHSAAAHAATIAGFAFHPGSITVAVGDTISWTNDDAADHTATADDGSFDTGQLAEGASGTHTFATAGTFAYHCAIHPSMHGTVTVVAAASGGTAGGGAPAAGGTAATPSSAPSAAAAPGTLPRTGWDPAVVAAAGAALLLAGLALRTRTQLR